MLLAAAFGAGVAESSILALVAHAATAMVDGAKRTTVNIGPVHLNTRVSVLLLAAAILGVIRLVLHLGIAYLPSRMAADAQAQMRYTLFDAYSRSTWDRQAEDRDGHLQELLTNQVGQATSALLQTATLFSAGSTFITLVVVAFLLGPLVALLVLVVAALLASVLRPLGKKTRRHSRELSAAQLAYAGSLGEAVRLAEETYTFGVAAAERGRIRQRIDIARDAFIRQQFTSRLSQGLYQGAVILLLVGGLSGLYASGTGRIGSLGAVVLILVRAASYGQQAQASWQVIQQAAPFLDRIADEEVNYREDALSGGDGPFPEGGTLRFDSVSFAYRRGRPVLTDLSFAAGSGEIFGIVGPSGVGKSTIVQLLLRMRTPTAGRIVLGGTPIDEISLEEWHRKVAYVPQEPRLLYATVADNIRFARDIGDEQVERAARLAHIHDDISRMPQGYDTPIGQRADAVSGGQRQRICLARALAGDPAVLVLDEPTSALDRASEAAIRASLLEMRGHLTMFLVTHQPSLLVICDQVLRVGEGHASVEPAPAADHLAVEPTARP